MKNTRKMDQENIIIDIDNRSICRDTISALIRHAKHDIAIFSQDLEYSLYHQSEINLAIKNLITTNRKANIRIIAKNSRLARQRSHCLINLAQNYSSFIKIKKPITKELMQFQQSWLLIDDSAYCLINNIERFQGKACFNDRLKVKESLDFFNHAWENSDIDQETRRLSL